MPIYTLRINEFRQRKMYFFLHSATMEVVVLGQFLDEEDEGQVKEELRQAFRLYDKVTLKFASHNTVSAFHFAISQLIWHRGLLSWNFSNSLFPRLMNKKFIYCSSIGFNSKPCNL